MERKISRILTAEYNGKSPVEKYEFFVSLITNTIKSHTPKKRRVPANMHRNPVEWWDAECSRMKRRRRAAYLKWEEPSGVLTDLLNFEKIDLEAQCLYKRKKRDRSKNLRGKSI